MPELTQGHIYFHLGAPRLLGRVPVKDGVKKVGERYAGVVNQLGPGANESLPLTYR